MKCKVGEFYARRMAGFPRILFGRERGNLRYAGLGLIKWLMYSPRKTMRGKLQVRYQGLTLRFAVNVDFLFFEQIFGLEIDVRYAVQFLVLFFSRKIGILICSENREVSSVCWL